jgi:hypothetical protein
MISIASAGDKLRGKNHDVASDMGGEQAVESEKPDDVHASGNHA